MPDSKLTCISDGLRDVLLHEGRHLMNPITKRDYENSLRELPTCPVGMLLGIESAYEKGNANTKKSGKRAPSAYNTYVGTCMKQGNDMKTCAANWRKEKERTGGRR